MNGIDISPDLDAALTKASSPATSFAEKLKSIPSNNEPLNAGYSDNTALFSLLNENKVLSIFENAILEKYGDLLEASKFIELSESLYRELELIEDFVVSSLKLAGKEISPDRNHWTRNKLRSQWAERVADSWTRAELEGIAALKGRVPAIIAISERQAGKITALSSEPFGLNEQTQLKLSLDKVAARAMEIAFKIQITSPEAIRMITQEISELALNYQNNVFLEVSQDGNTPGFVFSVCLDRVSNKYFQALTESSERSPETPYANLIKEASNRVESAVNTVTSVTEELTENVRNIAPNRKGSHYAR